MGFVSLEFIRMVEPENIEELRSQCELNQTVSICQTFRNQKEIRTKEIDGGYLGQFGVAVTKYPKLGTLLKKKKVGSSKQHGTGILARDPQLCYHMVEKQNGSKLYTEGAKQMEQPHFIKTHSPEN